jgi:hypothetical protein
LKELAESIQSVRICEKAKSWDLSIALSGIKLCCTERHFPK